MFRLPSRILKIKCNREIISTCRFQTDETPSPAVKTQSQWKKPKGYDTGIKVYNENLREKVPLILIRKGIATWYSCGPTVYADAHIGHASCYVKFDIVRMILDRMFNISVIMLMGITDIDDKIIKRAAQENCSIREISQKYEMDFLHDLSSLNVQLPTITTRVTEFIPTIISFCEVLIAKDFAYVTTEGNVYFIVSKVESEVVAEQDETELSSVIDPLKKDPRDFALWKASKSGEPSWPSPWGNGRPGWHIECSTMASHIFGSKIDIHTGGSDLCFPHHVNENSQCLAYHGNKQWINYWMHAGLLQLGSDVKMSKSVGNTITIKDFLKEHNANIFRIMCLQSHYRNAIQYSDESLGLARNMYLKLHNFLNDAEFYISGGLHCEDFNSEHLYSKFTDARESVVSAFADDFNTSRALKSIVDLVGETNKCFKPTKKQILDKNIAIVAAISSYIDQTLNLLGVDILCKKKMPILYNRFIDTIVKFRHEIRSNALSVSGSTITNTLTVTNIMAAPDAAENKSILFQESLKALKENLDSFDILFDFELKRPTADGANFIKNNQFWSFSGDINRILADLCIFCQNITPYYQSAFTDISEKNGYQKEAVAFKKHLLKACDDFRRSLSCSAICVKDFKWTSVWYPLDKICIDNLHKIKES